MKLRGVDRETFSAPLVYYYFKVAAIHSISSPFGYASLSHIDYPTLTLGKSCKLIPVIIMNYVLYRRVYPFYKYVSVFLITVGVSAFMLLHSRGKAAGANSLYGLLMLSINLALDGATNSAQDQIFKKFKVSGTHMMLYMNLFSGFLMLFWHLGPFGDNLSEAIGFCLRHPVAVWDIVLFSLCGAFGQCFIFYILEMHGSVTVVTVTVTRKLFTILISVLWFNHPLAPLQWLSVCLVFVGIGLDAYMKGRDTKSSQQASVKEIKQGSQPKRD
jgi:UDP-galactose transporter B1